MLTTLGGPIGLCRPGTEVVYVTGFAAHALIVISRRCREGGCYFLQLVLY